MSIKILLEDQIEKIFQDNPELNNTGKNKFEIAVAQIANVKYLSGLDFDDLIDGIMGNGGDEGIDLCYLFRDGFLVRESEDDINSSSKFIFSPRKDIFPINLLWVKSIFVLLYLMIIQMALK